MIKFIYLFDVLWHTENISVLGWWPPLRMNETGEFPRESHNNAADLGDLRSLATIVSKGTNCGIQQVSCRYIIKFCFIMMYKNGNLGNLNSDL